MTVAGAGIVIVGAFLPWATTFGDSVSGLQGDGIITAALGVLLGIAALVYIRRAQSLFTRLLIAVVGFAVVGLSLYDLSNVSRVIKESEFSELVQVGPGLYASVLGGVIAAFGGVFGTPKGRRAKS